MSDRSLDAPAPVGGPTRPAPLRLTPDRRRAAGWTALGVALVVMGAWIVVDSRGHPVALAAILLFVAVTGYFVVQLVAPALFTVELDPRWLEARTLWRSIRVPWEAVDVAAVPRLMGEPWFVVEVRVTRSGRRALPGEGPEDVHLQQVRIPLPVGADTGALHGWLEQRLGRGG